MRINLKNCRGDHGGGHDRDRCQAHTVQHNIMRVHCREVKQADYSFCGDEAKPLKGAKRDADRAPQMEDRTSHLPPLARSSEFGKDCVVHQARQSHAAG